MEPDTMRKVALALCPVPDRLSANLARLLGVNPRTVRRWLSGENEIPDEIADRLRIIATERLKRSKAALAILAQDCD